MLHQREIFFHLSMGECSAPSSCPSRHAFSFTSLTFMQCPVLEYTTFFFFLNFMHVPSFISFLLLFKRYGTRGTIELWLHKTEHPQFIMLWYWSNPWLKLERVNHPCRAKLILLKPKWNGARVPYWLGRATRGGVIIYRSSESSDVFRSMASARGVRGDWGVAIARLSAMEQRFQCLEIYEMKDRWCIHILFHFSLKKMRIPILRTTKYDKAQKRMNFR